MYLLIPLIEVVFCLALLIVLMISGKKAHCQKTFLTVSCFHDAMGLLHLYDTFKFRDVDGSCMGKTRLLFNT